jgi:hypothetical protein
MIVIIVVAVAYVVALLFAVALGRAAAQQALLED